MEVLNSYYPVLYRCPVVKLGGYAAQNRLRGEILAYLDFGGATGSAKDGLAESMLALATERGDLAPGQTVVEASSGTFGGGAGPGLPGKRPSYYFNSTPHPGRGADELSAGSGGKAAVLLPAGRPPGYGAAGTPDGRKLRRLLHGLFCQR